MALPGPSSSVTVKTRNGENEVSEDEGPGNADIENIPTLRPAFKKDGTVTAASSSSISDGAATLILMRESDAAKRGAKALGGNADIENIPTLRPAFKKDGTVTAASSSSISDGAATLILMRESDAAKRGAKALATIAGHSAFAHEPEWFTTAPVHAIRALHDQLSWGVDDVELYEINEAFACVTMAAMKDLGIDHKKVNVNGGACALGHPIGASGARIIVTLLHALQNRGGGKGIASLCIGGGEAVAIGIEV